MKSYTDIEQSKKLAEILPIESADCFWDYDEMQGFHRISWFEDGYDKDSQLRTNENNVSAWSLAALLSVLPPYQLQTQDDGIGILCSCNGKFNIVTADNPVDACYEMILKLKELNLL